MIIIEFNGLPGSGKTTIAKGLYDECVRNELSAVLYSRGYSRHYIIRKIQWGIRAFLYLLFTPKNLVRVVFKLSQHDNYRYKWDWLINYNRIKWYDNKADFLIVDQGAIQSVLSIIYNNCNQGQNNLIDDKAIGAFINGFNDYFSKCVIVNCNAPIESCVNRAKERPIILNSRTEKDGYGAYIKQQAQLDELRHYVHNVAYTAIDIDTTLSIACSVDSIMQLCGGLHKNRLIEC